MEGLDLLSRDFRSWSRVATPIRMKVTTFNSQRLCCRSSNVARLEWNATISIVQFLPFHFRKKNEDTFLSADINGDTINCLWKIKEKTRVVSIHLKNFVNRLFVVRFK